MTTEQNIDLATGDRKHKPANFLTSLSLETFQENDHLDNLSFLQKLALVKKASNIRTPFYGSSAILDHLGFEETAQNHPSESTNFLTSREIRR